MWGKKRSAQGPAPQPVAEVRPPTRVRMTTIPYRDDFARCVHQPACQQGECPRWVYPLGGELADLADLARQAAGAAIALGYDSPLTVLEPAMAGAAPEGSGWLLFEIEHHLDEQGLRNRFISKKDFWQMRLLPDGRLTAANWKIHYENGRRVDWEFWLDPDLSVAGHAATCSDWYCDHENLRWVVTEAIPSANAVESRVSAVHDGATVRDGRWNRQNPLFVRYYGVASILQSIIDARALGIREQRHLRLHA